VWGLTALAHGFSETQKIAVEVGINGWSETQLEGYDSLDRMQHAACSMQHAGRGMASNVVWHGIPYARGASDDHSLQLRHINHPQTGVVPAREAIRSATITREFLINCSHLVVLVRGLVSKNNTDFRFS